MPHDKRQLEQKLKAEVQRAEQAARILNDALYRSAWEQMHNALVQGIKDSDPVKDKDLREYLYMGLGMIDKLQRIFETTMETGKLAQPTLDELR
jgi:hypothetical protein